MKRICILLPLLFTLSGCATAFSSIDKQGEVYHVTQLTQGFLGNQAGALLVCRAKGQAAMHCQLASEP